MAELLDEMVESIDRLRVDMSLTKGCCRDQIDPLKRRLRGSQIDSRHSLIACCVLHGRRTRKSDPVFFSCEYRRKNK